MKLLLAAVFWSALTGLAMAQTNRIDQQRPDAPTLAAPGPFDIGVRTITVTHKDQLDVLTGPPARYDRPLTLEVWYPADLKGGQPGGDYTNVVLVDGVTRYTLHGQAVRDAAPLAISKPSPLVIISHGYPGNRFIVSHFGENLASKGYVVVAIDHFESTYDNQLGFASTLLNRSPDQLLVLDQIDQLSKAPGSFLHDIVDASNTAIIGFSMGGYGAVISAGGGLSEAATHFSFAPAGVLAALQAGTPTYEQTRDPRLKAIVAIGPWGRNYDFWDAEGLKDITIPALFMAGTDDEVSGYANGTRKIYEEATSSNRYLLSFEHAGHNAAAAIPAPAEAYMPDAAGKTGFEHYADFVWDTLRMNNIAQHFVTAFLDVTLRNETDKQQFLNVSAGADDDPFAEHDWAGFGPRTARGINFEHLVPAP